MRFLVVLTLLLLLPARADEPMSFAPLMAGAVTAGGGGGGSLTAASIASGSDSVSNPSTTASISPAQGNMLYAILGYAVEGGGNVVNADSATIVGGMSSWTILGRVDQSIASRRGIMVYRGTGTASSGTVSITVNTGSGTWTETFWIIVEVSGYDSGDPDDVLVYAGNWSVGATSGASGDVGTPGTGDLVVGAFIHETSEAVTLESGYTPFASLTGGTDLRTLTSGWILGSSDETPTATWSTSSGWSAVGWIINEAP